MRISKCPICNGDLAHEGDEIKRLSAFYIADVEYYHCSYCKLAASDMIIGHVNADGVVTHCREEMHFSRALNDDHCYHLELQYNAYCCDLKGGDV